MIAISYAVWLAMQVSSLVMVRLRIDAFEEVLSSSRPDGEHAQPGCR